MKIKFEKILYILNREWKTIINKNGSQSQCENVYQCDHVMKIKFEKILYFLNREWKTIINKNPSQSQCENVYQCDHKKKIIKTWPRRQNILHARARKCARAKKSFTIELFMKFCIPQIPWMHPYFLNWLLWTYLKCMHFHKKKFFFKNFSIFRILKNFWKKVEFSKKLSNFK